MTATNKIKLTHEQRRILLNVKERGYPNDGSAAFAFLQEKQLVAVHAPPRAGWFVTRAGDLALERDPGELAEWTKTFLAAAMRSESVHGRTLDLIGILIERIEALEEKLETHASSPHCRGCSCGCGVYPCICGRCK